MADPVGLKEIAERLEVRRQTAAMWHYRQLLPAPRWTVSGQPAWDWSDIEPWAATTGRSAPTGEEVDTPLVVELGRRGEWLRRELDAVGPRVADRLDDPNPRAWVRGIHYLSLWFRVAEDHVIADARKAGMSWEQVGAVYGMSRQGAQLKFGKAIGEEWQVEVLVREAAGPTDWVPLGQITEADLRAHRELVADFSRRGITEPTERLHRLTGAGAG